MINLNKNIILIGLICGVILLASCKADVSQPTLKTPATSTAKETAPAPTQQIVSPAPAAQETPVDATDIKSLKCDENAYNILVKPKHTVTSIMVESVNEQKIKELKAENLIEELVEVIKNDGSSAITVKWTEKGVSGGVSSSGSASQSIIPGWVWFIADLKKENSDTVSKKIQELAQAKVGTGYGGYGIGWIWDNYGDKDSVFEFKCRIATGPGRITVYSNIPESTFTVSGPKSYTGNGLCWTTFDVPAGKYAFTFNDVAGYTAPGKFSGGGISQVTSELRPEEHLKLGANYRADTPADLGVIAVITNLQESKFTITGNATYSGSGTCWGQANVPTGQYEVVFDDVPGYELSYFDKKKSIYVSSGFGQQTAEAEYKKIGE